MMIMKNLILLTFAAVLLSCSNNEKPAEKKADLKDFSWILGKWANKDSAQMYVEFWEQSNDSTYKGNSYMLGNGDTLFSEKLSLELRADGIYYVPVTSNQNEQKPVLFKLVKDSVVAANTLVFENKLHDFPQRIVYEHPHADTIKARIEGMDKGKFRMEAFPMYKIN